MGVATLYEAAGRTGLVDLPLTRVGGGPAVAGPARTAACGQGDNRAVHEVMSVLAPGDVLVAAMPDPAPVALLGELLGVQASVHGAAAVLVGGSVRDVAELRELGLPVWARWVRATGATKTERGRVDAPVTLGGAEVRPGDAVVLDDDGAVVVAADRVGEVLAAARARLEREAAMRARLRSGELSYDIYGMRSEDAR
ncbi:dimethylmenaquinone methyltransferase [Actinomadura chibensis]|uniref:Putative 4-hydroxy-4-methyl-2-oxoglutarate aldolase n=2 Tax=Actinomadura chibensis TaxID=392828 RepID=A0A5D0NDS8_9ACTN|nr:dimethylmenaquinone methyltransferase [Actinomadura chibensis]